MLTFTRHRKPDLRRGLADARVTVRSHTLRFNTEATCWLRVYLNTGLQLKANKNLSLEKAR